jgi:hypothetical protein
MSVGTEEPAVEIVVCITAPQEAEVEDRTVLLIYLKSILELEVEAVEPAVIKPMELVVLQAAGL